MTVPISVWNMRAQPPTSTLLSDMATNSERLAISADGTRLAGVHCTGYDDSYILKRREITIWDMAATPPVPTSLGFIPGGDVYILSLALSRDGTRLAIAGSDDKNSSSGIARRTQAHCLAN